MPDYKKMYFELFNSVTNAIELLQKTQQAGEQRYIEGDKTALILLQNSNENSKQNK